MPIRQTLKEAGYEFVEKRHGGYILKCIETGKLEFWFANKGHASYGLKYKNTHLEFAHSVPLTKTKDYTLAKSNHVMSIVEEKKNTEFWR